MKSVLIAFLSLLALPAIATNYNGTSFEEVSRIIQDKELNLKSETEKLEFRSYQKNNFPIYPVNSKTVFKTTPSLEADAIRTIQEQFDYYDYLPKKLHPNGVCITGKWKINQNSNYSGYFKSGSEALFIGRISTTMENVNLSEKRGFGFAGKLYPTMNRTDIVKTGNFFTVDILMGTKNKPFLTAEMTNEPETGFDISVIGLGLKIASALKAGDENPSFRPLTGISGLNETSTIRTPRWIKIGASQRMIKNNESDFRKEVLFALEQNKTLIFDVQVSDTTKDTEDSGWNKIGQIEINSAYVSYSCDRRLHFAHPKMNP